MTVDDTLKTLYNEFEATHYDSFSNNTISHPSALTLDPADRQILENEYGELAGSVDAYNATVQQLNDAAEKYIEAAEAAVSDLPDVMGDDGITTRITYEDDMSRSQTKRPAIFFTQLEETLTGHDERMLEDYLVQELEDGEQMAATWSDATDQWHQDLYAAAEDHDIDRALHRLHHARGKYKQMGNMLRNDLQDALEHDEDSSLLDRLLGR